MPASRASLRQRSNLRHHLRQRVVTELIASGEGPKIEFKAAFRWDDRQERENPELQRATTKTIAAFLNSDGGHLLIGVQDNGTICGLDQEFAAIGRQGRDTRISSSST